MNMNDYETLIEKHRNGITPGFGWGTYPMACPRCGRQSVHVAMVYTKGFGCLGCGYKDAEFIFLPSAEQVKNDGPFLQPAGWERADIITPN